MAGKIHVDSIDVITDLGCALARFQVEAAESLRRSENAIHYTSERLEIYGRRLVQRIDECTWEVNQARRDLSNCQDSGGEDQNGSYEEPDCDFEKDILADAVNRLHSLHEQYERMQRLVAQMRTSVSTFRSTAQRLSDILQDSCPRGQNWLKSYASALDEVVRLAEPVQGASRTSSIISGSINLTPSTGTQGPACSPSISETGAWETRERTEFDVSQIDLNDSHVQSESDFNKVPFSEMASGLHKLETIVRPAVLEGKGGEYFSRIDAEQQLEPRHGYREIFNAFYGDVDPVKVTWDGNKWSAESGCHRLWVAKRLGIKSIPVRMTMRGSAWAKFDDAS